MAEQDEFRVEARLSSAAGRGLGATSEQIQALQERREMMDKINRGPPEEAFAKILERTSPATEAPTPSRSAAARTALPKQAPRPGLRRPGEQAAYGVKRKTTVVLKG